MPEVDIKPSTFILSFFRSLLPSVALSLVVTRSNSLTYQQCHLAILSAFTNSLFLSFLNREKAGTIVRLPPYDVDFVHAPHLSVPSSAGTPTFASLCSCFFIFLVCFLSRHNTTCFDLTSTKVVSIRSTSLSYSNLFPINSFDFLY